MAAMECRRAIAVRGVVAKRIRCRAIARMGVRAEPMRRAIAVRGVVAKRMRRRVPPPQI